ncbi:hypothetical protein QQ045_014560 [Rhodiola kirilowii]
MTSQNNIRDVLTAFSPSSDYLVVCFGGCIQGLDVTFISFSSQSSCIYTAGVDGMVCKIYCMNGNMLEKFKASA